jgi:hypothetical protein
MNCEKNYRKIIGTIFLLYGLFLLLIYSQIGCVYGGEGAKYVYLANILNINTWSIFWDTYKFNFSYILYIKLGQFLFSTKVIFIWIHIILNFIGAILILKIVEHFKWPKVAGCISILLFLLCYPLQYWTFTLFSETSFIFLTILFFYLGIKLSRKTILLFIVVSFLLMFWRPQGLQFLLIISIFLLYHYQMITQRTAIIGYSLTLIILAVMMLIVEVDGALYLFYFFNYTPVLVTIPPWHPELHPTDNLLHCYQILIRELGWYEATKLHLNKIVWFFNMTRSYYSFYTNIVMTLSTILFFGLGLPIIYSLGKIDKQKEFVYMTVFMLLSCLTNVFFSHNEWHNRYNIVFFPFLCICMGYYLSQGKFNEYFKTKK